MNLHATVCQTRQAAFSYKNANKMHQTIAYIGKKQYLCGVFNTNTMKKTFYLCALAALLIGCKGQNDPEQVQAVQFKVSTFTQTTEPMPSQRKAPILDDEGGTALTDLYVFDGTTQLAHQTNDDANFGTVTLNLTHGNHNLSFILTRSTGITVENGVMTMSSIRSTFGKLLALNVTASTGAQDLTLDRISGQLQLTINDAFPTTANEIEFVINPRYTQMNVTNLQGVNGDEWSQRVSCTAKQGQTGVQYTFNHICPSLTDEYTADVTINIYNAGGSVIYTVTIDDVRFASNTKTILSGNLFTTPSASVGVNTSWNSNIVGTW